MDSREITFKLNIVPVEKDALSQHDIDELAEVLIEYGLDNGVSVVLKLLEDKETNDE